MKFANIIEVGLRDGLQTEKRLLSSHFKLHTINQLVRAGLKDIEITSFVNTKLVPQFNDNYHIARNVLRYNNVRYSALVPNERGYFQMRESGIKIQKIYLNIQKERSYRDSNSG